MAFIGWKRKCAVTIQSSKVAANFSDFTVMLTQANLPSEMFDSDGDYCARSDGGDIRFSSDSAGNTPLAREISSFITNTNPANGKAEIFVKIPSLSASTNTTIYVWYGNLLESEPTESDTYGKINAWDSSYKGIWHFNGSAASTVKKSNSVASSLAFTEYNSPTAIAGFSGLTNGAYYFDGASNYLGTSNSSGGALYGNSSTIEAWIRPSSWTAEIASVFFDYNDTSDLIYLGVKNDGSNNNLEGHRGGATGSWVTDYSHNLSLNTWYHAAFTCNNTEESKIYYNGSLANSSMTLATPNTGSSSGIEVGARHWATWYDYSNITIDELRLSNSKRSAEFLLTNYNNQSSPSTFATVGTPSNARIFVPTVIII